MENPLVSLIVVSYNSAKYIIETLESIRNQTYEKIELIISDDCSDDDTLRLCKDWINHHYQRFLKVQTVTSKVNTGVSANCNRASKLVSGDWLMIIGADDSILPDCVQYNIDFIKDHVDASVVHSNSFRYANTFDKESFLGVREFDKLLITHTKITARDQYQIILRGSKVNSTTVFFKKQLLIDFEYFDESIPMIDDWPFWLKITSAGVKIFFLNKVTANYRVRYDSIANEAFKGKLSNDQHLRTRNIYIRYIIPNVSMIERLFIHYEYYRIILCQKYGLNSSFWLIHIIYWLIARPSMLYFKLKQILVEKGIRRRIAKMGNDD